MYSCVGIKKTDISVYRVSAWRLESRFLVSHESAPVLSLNLSGYHQWYWYFSVFFLCVFSVTFLKHVYRSWYSDCLLFAPSTRIVLNYQSHLQKEDPVAYKWYVVQLACSFADLRTMNQQCCLSTSYGIAQLRRKRRERYQHNTKYWVVYKSLTYVDRWSN